MERLQEGMKGTRAGGRAGARELNVFAGVSRKLSGYWREIQGRRTGAKSAEVADGAGAGGGERVQERRNKDE